MHHKTVQTKCTQTLLDPHTGELLGYRLTLPVPKEFADDCDFRYIVVGKNKVHYFIWEGTDFERLTRIKLEVQIKVNGMKLAALQQRHLRLTKQYSKL